MTIPEGTILYHIFAWTAPGALGGFEVYIGDLVTDSIMTTSAWGDEHMYIRHARADDDIALKPEWGPYYPYYTPTDTPSSFNNPFE